MKKRNVFFLVACVALCFMAGCGRSVTEQEGGGTKTPEATPTGAVNGTNPVQENEKQPDEVTVSFQEEIDEAKDGEVVYFTSKIYYPVFEGNYADNLNRFVSAITEEFRASLPTAKENAALDYSDSKEDNFLAPIFPEVEEFTVSCVWKKEQRQVLFTKWFSDIGGAHPSTYCRAYVVDMTDGSQEEIDNIVKAYGITKEELITYVAEEFRKEHGENLYLYDDENDYEAEIARFLEENQWYLTEKGLVVFANPYELAAYVYGMLECEIPYEVLEGGLKK